MNTSKKYLNSIAKTIFKKSLTAGNIDEKKVRVVVKKLLEEKPPKLFTILKTYKRLVSEKVAKEEIVIETNDKITLPKNYAEILRGKTGAKIIVNKVNPKIVFGAKVYYGDWVWDDTLEGKLEQLTQSNNSSNITI